MDSRQQKRTGTETWSWLLGGVGTLLSLSFVIYALGVDVIERHWIAVGVVGIVGILSWITIERRNLLQTSQQRGTQNQITGFLLIGLAFLSILFWDGGSSLPLKRMSAHFRPRRKPIRKFAT